MADWKGRRKREPRKTKDWDEVELGEENVKLRWKEEWELEEERIGHDEELDPKDRSDGSQEEKH